MEEGPIMELPDDILSKIIGYIPITQWPHLEMINSKVRNSTLMAWRSLRKVDLKMDFIYDPNDISALESVFEKLVLRTPSIKCLENIVFDLNSYPERYTKPIEILSKLENLKSLDFGNIYVENFTQFIDSTQSRTNLKELKTNHLLCEDVRPESSGARFKLEKFDCPCKNFFDPSILFIDPSIMTTLRFHEQKICGPNRPTILFDIIESARNLCDLEFHLICDDTCKVSHLAANKRLMEILESLVNLNKLQINGLFFYFGTQHSCMNFESEFMHMLKTVGPRLHRLGLNYNHGSRPLPFASSTISAIIAERMTNLKSILLGIGPSDYYEEDLKIILDSRKFEEIKFSFHSHVFLDLELHPRFNDQTISMIGQQQQLEKFRVRSPICRFQTIPSPICRYSGLATAISLRNLNIQDARHITDQTFADWSQSFGKNLETLKLETISLGVFDGDLWGTMKVETALGAFDGLLKLIKSAVRLQSLKLQFDGYPLWMQRNQRNLGFGIANTNPSGMENIVGEITDNILLAIAEHRPSKISNIEIYWSPGGQVSLAAIQSVIDGCPNLVNVELPGLENHREQLKIAKYRKINFG